MHDRLYPRSNHLRGRGICLYETSPLALLNYLLPTIGGNHE